MTYQSSLFSATLTPLQLLLVSAGADDENPLIDGADFQLTMGSRCALLGKNGPCGYHGSLCLLDYSRLLTAARLLQGLAKPP